MGTLPIYLMYLVVTVVTPKYPDPAPVPIAFTSQEFRTPEACEKIAEEFRIDKEGFVQDWFARAEAEANKLNGTVIDVSITCNVAKDDGLKFD